MITPPTPTCTTADTIHAGAETQVAAGRQVLEDAALGRDVLVRGDAARGRLVHSHSLRHSAQVERPEPGDPLVEEALLMTHDLGSDLQDRARPLVEAADEPAQAPHLEQARPPQVAKLAGGGEADEDRVEQAEAERERGGDADAVPGARGRQHALTGRDPVQTSFALDLVDGAARVYDPIVRGEAGEDLYGCFLKDYARSAW